MPEMPANNGVRRRLCTQKGTQVSRIFATAKRGVNPKGDAEGGILELQLEAAVLELMVFGGTEKREWVGESRIVPTYVYSTLFEIIPALSMNISRGFLVKPELNFRKFPYFVPTYAYCSLFGTMPCP